MPVYEHISLSLSFNSSYKNDKTHGHEGWRVSIAMSPETYDEGGITRQINQRGRVLFFSEINSSSLTHSCNKTQQTEMNVDSQS